MPLRCLLIIPLLLIAADAADAAPTARFTDSEWYLVYRPDLARGRDRTLISDPAAFGHVHRTDERAWLVEVPRENLDRFFAAAFRLQYVDPAALAPAQVAAARADAPAVTVADAALKGEYVDALDQQHYDQLIREITGDTFFWFDGDLRTVTTRYFNTASNALVAAYLAGKLASWGYAVALDTFTVNGHICRNVVATKTGTTTPEEIVVVGGHYDSISPQPSTLAPGAEDNASGTSLVMEIARASADRQFDRTVQFVLFDAEEVGLRGSIHFVQDAVDAGRDIVAAIIADMVAYYDQNYGVIIEGQEPWEWLMALMEANVTTHTDIASRKDYFSWGSDHVPFQQAGIPAFLAIDWDWADYPHYHRTTDTWEQIAATSHLGLQISRAAAATLADVAGLLPEATTAPAAPAAPVLLTAQPNPFNPRVALAFELAAPARGALTVHDLRGRRLATLAQGSFPAGASAVHWDGSDERGAALPSGVYLGRLRTDQGTASVKLQLVR